MRRFIFLVGIALFYLGCEDVIEVEVPSSEPRLSIDANFNLFTQETPLRFEGGVRLTLSSDFFEDGVPLVNDATVIITDLGSGIEYPLLYDGTTEYYRPENPAVLGNFDTEYELTIIYDSETYRGVTSFIPVAPINEVRQGTNTLFDGDETEVIVEFTDDGSRDDYYLYDFGFDIFRPLEDRFFQGEDFVFSSFYDSDDVQPGDTVTIKAYGISAQYYTYFELVIEQAGEGGGPFQSVPATTRGNMINTTNFDNYPLGYFLISEADEFELVIE
ncbi:DUF4249 domain-containing protein [Flavobacteriaceae bacterium TP-CH-4]|uniref:DUF4249 domain-containing protein n=1 Tax=Pelagihabitans pacificus TaxID=2696054 RepID=A0A967EAM2_9FLAO|nr:DUF4249 family protein [Pelagihabitans pacificus]NHF59566.1 DUF4249 domain-containing protein [Pelagihabitans pacificus]